MAAMLSSFPIIAAGGLVYAFQQSTLPGKIILLSLFTASVFSWTVLVT
jgi:hypothetical protein